MAVLRAPLGRSSDLLRRWWRVWVQGHIKFNVMTYENQSPMLIKMVGEQY